MRISLSLLLILIVFASCNSSKKLKQTALIPKVIEPTVITSDGTKTDPFLENLLKLYPSFFDSVLLNRKKWNVQIIYTQIDRGANNLPKLTNYYFNVNPHHYFYPASTVKLPTALLALQKLNELKSTGIDRNSTMITEAEYNGQTAVLNDPLTIDGRPHISSYIKKIFLVSDNDAFNRLYEFLGQKYINENLHNMGYEDVQILHRLQIPLSEDENRHTNPVKFLDNENKIIYQQPMQYNQVQYMGRNDSLGNQFYSGDKLINSPMNFSKKNRIALEDLHNILRSVIFPKTVPARQRFNLSDEDYKFIHRCMSEYPGESYYPPYDTTQYPDGYGKFLIYGDQKGNLPKNLRIFNKIGDAYGQMIDVAYVVDFDKKVEFFLTAEIYCNTDEIMNDDKYDYETIGYPFMKNLGRVIYDYESKRVRAHLPDLSEFKMNYDK